MFVMHVALQGCFTLRDVPYGLTADTGGHIRYILDLANALARCEAITRQEIVTRGFRNPVLGPIFEQPEETLGKVTLRRLFGETDRYLSKEDLYQDIPALSERFIEWLRVLDRRPDVIHAHYSDAGLLALAARRAFGIPYIFTAHSLGRVKEKTFLPETSGLHGRGCVKARADLHRRIVCEEEVIDHADRVIASSDDEADEQYALYDSADRRRIVVNPPGCDLTAFSRISGGDDSISAIEPFLSDPTRPQVLAVARPVRKKNLIGLVRAFGQSAELQKNANLIIYAGTRTDIDQLEPEQRDVLSEMLNAIDRYDLYGKVALPKQHASRDIPSIMASARDSGGVFVNVALHEPFGLTFLEAAAAGLPSIATDRGGPNDIINRCGSGVLVDPRDTSRIADEALRLLVDRSEWQRLSQAGTRCFDYFNWDRHASTYVADLRRLTEPAHVEIAAAGRSLLLSDIDNTLLGDADALDAFRAWLGSQSSLTFGISTGRTIHSALDILHEHEAPLPSVLVTSVGTEIYYPSGADRFLVADHDYAAHIGWGWEPDRLERFFARRTDMTLQSPTDQRRFKRSYFADLTAAEVEELRSELATENLQATIVQSHNRFLDVVPVRAGKGAALDWLRSRLVVKEGRCFAAGDSGNDVDMLLAADRGIVVANHYPEIAYLDGHPTIVMAKRNHAFAMVDVLSKELGPGLIVSRKMRGLDHHAGEHLGTHARARPAEPAR